MVNKLAVTVFLASVLALSYVMFYLIGPDDFFNFGFDFDIPFYSMNYSVLYGVVSNSSDSPISGALISLIGNDENFSGSTDNQGKFNISGITPGVYTIRVEKEGYRASTLPSFMFMEGHYYPWNLTLNRDCLYFAVNTSANYAVRYGFNGTIYKGNITYHLAYPEGAEYLAYPAEDSRISFIDTFYRAGNRMLSFSLDNLNGRYSYIQNHIYVDISGSNTLRLFESNGMSVSDSASAQPGYLGVQTGEDGRKMIDPYDGEIKAVADSVRLQAGSDGSWELARALFAWLKENTEYYHGSGSDTYAQSASEILSSRKGDCDELSFLYISLCRSAGIPARFVEGYMVEHDAERYIGHVWTEFYDGEWIPVEVAGSGDVNTTWELATRFGVGLPDHVPIFIDDGTDASVSKRGYRSNYYDSPPTVNPYTYYDISESGKKYIMDCADGTRSLVDEKQ